MLLEIMGGFRLRTDRPVDRLRTRKTEVLLAYLALNPGCHARANLIELFWPDDEPESARQKLRSALNSIRTAVGDRLVADRECVSISDLATDYQAWRETAKGALHGSDLKRLVEEYRPILPSHDADPLDAVRAEAELAFEECLRALLSIQLESSPSEALATAYRLTKLMPDDESTHAQVLTLLRASGKTGRLARHLETVREHFGRIPASLAEFVTTDPVSEKLAGTRATTLVGREAELEELRALLLGPDEPVAVTLVGPPGVGKTRLASEMRAYAAEEDVEFVFLPLAGLSQPHELRDAVRHSLHAGDPVPIREICSHLPPTLLVLDNWEHLPDEAASLLDDLLAEGSSLRILVTSQRPVEHKSERLFSLRTLETPADPHPETARPSASETLFVQTARQISPHLLSAKSDATLIAEICAGLSGLPLAIELTAKALDVMSLAQVAVQVKAGASAKVAGRSTVADAVARSLDLLDAETRSLLERLPVFPASFSPESVALIFGEEALAGLRLLHNRSLIALVEWPTVRYQILDPIRAALGRSGEALPLLEFADRFLDLARRFGAHLPADYRGSLDDELPNLEAAIRIKLARDEVDDAAELVQRTFFCWIRWGRFATAQEFVSSALSRLPEDQRKLRSSLTGFLGSIEYFRGDNQASERWYRQALELAEVTNDALAVAGAQVNVGLALCAQRRHAEAEPLLIQAEREIATSGIARKEVSVLFLLSDAAYAGGDVAAARVLLDRATAICVDDPELLAYLGICCRKLGDLAWLEGDLARALMQSLRSHEIMETAGESHLRRVEAAERLVWIYCLQEGRASAQTYLEHIIEKLLRPNLDQAFVLSLRAGAIYAATQAQTERAAQLCGAIGRLSAKLNLPEDDWITKLGNDLLRTRIGQGHPAIEVGATLSLRECATLLTTIAEA